jgi:hypothetical protein
MLARTKGRKPRPRKGAATRKAGTPGAPDVPLIGFYRFRLKRGGPFVALQIWLGPVLDPDTGEEMEGRGWRYQARLNGSELVPVGDYWPSRCRDRISEAEYAKLCRLSATMDPEHPFYDPLRAVDPLKSPMPF